MISRRLLMFGFAGTATLFASPAATQRVWTIYRNNRFGTTIEYPSDKFSPTPSPARAAGLQFIAADGGEFSVAAINNVLSQNLAAIENSLLKNRARGERIIHRDKGSNWFLLSGTRGNIIFYERHLLSHRREIINDFEITYPAGLRRVYDPIVARMSRSFRAGVGIDTGPP